MLRIKNFVRFELLQGCSKKTERRQLWGYVAIAFNQVDAHRLQLVGPDRLCAEWLLKNGGAVRFKELPNRLVADYNVLPAESQKLHVKVADASNSSVMKIGLEHFKDCKYIDTVFFDCCKHLEADGLGGLVHLKSTLKELVIKSCPNLSDGSFEPLVELKNLTTLCLGDLQYVKDIDAVAKKLRAELPKCNVTVTK